MQPGMAQKPIISFKVEGIHVHSLELCFEHNRPSKPEELSGFTVMVLTSFLCNLNNTCTLSIKLMPIFSFWDPAVLPLETFSRLFGHNRCLHWANHIAPLTRVAPCSLSLLSTLAGQLWSCQGGRSANATQLALGRLRYGV